MIGAEFNPYLGREYSREEVWEAIQKYEIASCVEMED